MAHVTISSLTSDEIQSQANNIVKKGIKWNLRPYYEDMLNVLVLVKL